MITRAEIIPMLLKACPSFQAAWDEHLAYWAEEEAGIYNDTAEFVHYLDRCRENGDFGSIESGLGAVERLIADGDAYTKEIAIIGLLETIQNVSSHSGSQQVYERYIGPKSRRAWRQLNRDWEKVIERKQRLEG
jgi:hypothetical protein